MTNQEVLEQYNTEKWVVEETLCYLLQLYWERYGSKAIEQAKDGYISTQMPKNPVTFVKEFMKEETYCNVEFAEKSKMDTVSKGVIIDVTPDEIKEV